MNFGESIVTSVVFLIALVLLPLQAFGTALDNSGISCRGALMGSALSGLADDASAVFFNPAGLVGPERKTTWDIDLVVAFNMTNFTYANSNLENKSNDVYTLPNFFMSKRINDRWAVGFGAYTPFAGGGATYDNFLQTGQELSIMAGYAAFTPAVAYKINDQWAIGLGISGYYGINKYKNQSVETDYNGFAGLGAYASVMYRPSSPWSIGLTFRSPVNTKLDGHLKIAGTSIDSGMEIDLPYYVDLGIGYQKDKLKVGTSFVWMAYGNLDEYRQTMGSVTISTKTGYKDGYRISLGGEYALSERLSAYAGVRFLSGAQKDEFITPISNDVDMLALSGGVRWSIVKDSDFLMGYVHIWGFEKTVGAEKFNQGYDTIVFSIRQQF